VLNWFELVRTGLVVDWLITSSRLIECLMVSGLRVEWFNCSSVNFDCHHHQSAALFVPVDPDALASTVWVRGW
jgi:hypothetical protein